MSGKLRGSGANTLRAGKIEQDLGTSSHQKCSKMQAQGMPLMLKDGIWPPNSCTYANTCNTDRENQHLFLLRKEKVFLFGRSTCSEPSATQVLYSNSRKMHEKQQETNMFSLLLYSSKATHPLYNHKNSDRKGPKPFCFLPSCPIIRGVWTWTNIFYFPHVCWYLSALCNIKQPQEKRMEEL